VAPASPKANKAPVIVDLQALQSSTTRDRGIGKYALSWVAALEALDANLVRAYLLNPRLSPPGALDAVLSSGKVRYAETIDLAGIELWHTMSPFDLRLSTDSIIPSCIPERGLRHSATVYDLIPALDPDRELSDPVERRRYRTRLEVIRSADAVLTLSEKVADDLIARARLAKERVYVVGAAPSAKFVPPPDAAIAQAAAIDTLGEQGLAKPFILASSGSHPRKNNEALIRAFCALNLDLAAGFQLVITGDIDAPTTNHYHHLASTAGRDGSVVVAGFVPDDLLVTLTQGATLCVVAALAEGFGLPIVEAQACGTPVIAADLAPFDELVIDSGRFDPTADAAITAALELVLRDTKLREALRTSPVSTWDAVAHHSATAFEAILARKARRIPRTQVLRRRRARVAFVTPMPPAPTGVAGYSYALINALIRTEKVSVNVFCDGDAEGVLAPSGAVVHPVSAFSLIEAIAGRFDHVVYAFGNSHHHIGALELLGRRPGVVIAHDVRLSNLYRHAHGDPAMLPGGFEGALREMYPDELPDGVGSDGQLSSEDVSRYGLLMAREVIAKADRYLVNSNFAASLARLDARPLDHERIGTLSFAFSGKNDEAPGFVEDAHDLPPALPEEFRRAWGAPPRPGVVVAHFGIVDPMKRPEVLLRAHAALRRTGGDVVLAFVGPIGDELCAMLAGLATELGTASAVIFTGPLSPADYRRWLNATTVAVQLRAGSNGEASAAVGECLGAGLPTIVSDLGWAGELPDGVCVKVPAAIGAGDLAMTLEQLLGDSNLRHMLGEGARALARSATFDRTARELLSVLSSPLPTDRTRARDEAAWSPSLASYR
jgi:glycosyltransferase involved in cell wall biosynthesis